MMKLGGSLTRQAERDFTLDDNNPHVANIGHMVEEMENSMRSTLDQIYFGKTKDIVNDLRWGGEGGSWVVGAQPPPFLRRSVRSLKDVENSMSKQKALAAELMGRNK